VKKFLSAAVIVLAVFSLFACGSNGNKSPRLTRAKYVAKANRLCKATHSENALQTKETGKAEEAIKAAAGLLENLQSDLRKLRPPSQMEADVNAWLATGDEGVSTLKTFAKEAVGLDLNKDPLAALTAPSYTKLVSVNKTYDAQATKLGLTECSSQGY
jgi:hypothetical protein